MTQKYTGLNYLQCGLSPTSDCFLHSPWWKFHFYYFQFYVIPKIKQLYWRNSLNKWNVCGWLYSASKKIIFISEKRKKQNTNLSGCYLMPTYPISYGKVKFMFKEIKKMRTCQDALELSPIPPEQRRSAMNDEHFSLQRINPLITWNMIQ